MAKKSWRERNKRKAETVKKYAAIRAELKAKRDYAGLAKLPASERTRVSQQLQALGVTTEHFTIWLDSKQQVRKVVTSAQGSKVQETSTIQVTSINGPVSAAIPPASQTATVPASELGGSGANGSAEYSASCAMFRARMYAAWNASSTSSRRMMLALPPLPSAWRNSRRCARSWGVVAA